MSGILRQDTERITAHLNELGRRGVFHIDPGLNGGRMALVEIRDRFWPYRKRKRAIGPGSEQAEFIGKVRDLFLTPACVRAVFTAADEAVAGCLYDRGITPEQVQRAILLGCARKYVLDDQQSDSNADRQSAVFCTTD